MTNPVRDIEVALGKYLAAIAMFALLCVISLEFPLILAKYGEPDWGAILAGYLGLLLCGMAFIAIGLFASSLTSNQIAAAVLGILFLLFFWLMGLLSRTGSPGLLGDVIEHVSILDNFEDFQKGIIDTKPVLYFLSVTGFALFLTVRTLESRRMI